MGLKMKTFREILNDMAHWISTSSDKLTNFYVGSVIRTMLEAIAVVVESLYFQMHKGFRYAIENSIYHSFGFFKFPATYATGEITLRFRSSLTQKIIIPKGYIVSSTPLYGDSIQFEVMEDTVAHYGYDEVVLPIICLKSGVVGNVPAYSIRRFSTPIVGIAEIYNDTAITSGRPEETKADRKKRFTMFIETLSKGTINALEYGCLEIPGVTGAYVDEQIGSVRIYVHDSSGNLPDSLRVLVENNMINYRAAGIQISILPVSKKPIDLTVGVMLRPSFNHNQYRIVIEDSIARYLNYYVVSKNLIKADLIRHIMSIDENAILNIDLDMLNDLEISEYELIRSGEIEVIIR